MVLSDARCVDALLDRVAGGGAEVMVATHNQPSIEHTVARMADLGLDPPGEQGVFFGQLLGMADHLTFTLGRSGYRVSASSLPVRHACLRINCSRCRWSACSILSN